MSDEPFDPAAVALPPPSEQQGQPGHDAATGYIRAARIMRLRAAGASYAAIAEAEGYSDPATARNALIRALRRNEAENVSEMRALENERLDMALSRIVALLGHEDPMVRLRAADSLTRNSKRRADLNGLDAPKQVQISAGVLGELEQAYEGLRLIVTGEAEDVTPDPPALEA